MQSNYSYQLSGASMAMALNGYDPRHRSKKESKAVNHEKENKRNIKRIAQSVKAKQKQESMEKERQSKRYVLPKFRNVDSKLKQHMAEQARIEAEKRRQKEMKKAATQEEELTHQSEMVQVPPVTRCRSAKMKRKPSVPTRHQVNHLKRNEEKKDYVASNRQKVIEHRVSRCEEEEMNFMQKQDYGKVPDYLIQRKLELLEQKEREREEAERAKIPKGMRKMEEEERLETLALLQQKKKDLEFQIGRLPLRIETLSMKKKDKSLRNQLREMEEAIQVFSKKIVFIADSSATEA